MSDFVKDINIPTNDYISRQAAIEAVEKSMYENPHENEIHRGMHDHEHRHFLTILMGLPSAQPATNCSEIPNGSDDTISRQAAIDAALEDVSDKRTHEFNAGAIRAANRIKSLPSAQPEIIRCKDCKYRDKYGCCKYWKGLAMGDIPIATDDYDFCSYAKRI